MLIKIKLWKFAGMSADSQTTGELSERFYRLWTNLLPNVSEIQK